MQRVIDASTIDLNNTVSIQEAVELSGFTKKTIYTYLGCGRLTHITGANGRILKEEALALKRQRGVRNPERISVAPPITQATPEQSTQSLVSDEIPDIYAGLAFLVKLGQQAKRGGLITSDDILPFFQGVR